LPAMPQGARTARIADAGAVPRLFGGDVDGLGMPAGMPAGTVSAPGATAQLIDTPTQEDALRLIATTMQRDAMAPEIHGLARALTKGCPARNDWCELKAIYDGIKNGRSDLKPYGLENGLRYLADSRTDVDGEPTDVFFSPTRVLAMLKKGENGFDCDDHTMLVGALAKAAGFRAGARAYGQGPDGYEHVFAIALIPKRGPWNYDAQGRVDESHVVGLDTTVPSARAGWQPPRGDVFTAL